jgi:hypothetical protein
MQSTKRISEETYRRKDGNKERINKIKSKIDKKIDKEIEKIRRTQKVNAKSFSKRTYPKCCKYKVKKKINKLKITKFDEYKLQINTV